MGKPIDVTSIGKPTKADGKYPATNKKHSVIQESAKAVKKRNDLIAEGKLRGHKRLFGVAVSINHDEY